MSYKFLSNLTVINSTFSPYNSGGTANDSLKVSSSNLGASFGVQNTNASGYAGIEYIDNSGNVKVFTGFNNGNGQEFRFNNVASGGYIDFLIGGTTGLKLFNNRNVTIGSSTDAGYKLDVNGTGRVQGALTVAGNIAFSGNSSYSISQSSNYQLTIYAGNINIYNTNSGLTLQNSFWFGGGANVYDNVSATQTNTNPATNGSAFFKLSSTRYGFLKPTMTTTQRDAIATPAAGLSVYNTTTNTQDYYNGSAWVSLQTSITNPVTGTGTTNYLSKWTSSSTLNTSLVYDDGTNVGIGTSTPGQKLDVNGNIRLSSNSPSIISYTSYASNIFTVKAQQTTGQDIGGMIIDTGNGESRFGSFRLGGGYFTTFYVNNAELIRLSTSNNVLIGTTTDAGYKLDVNGIGRYSSTAGGYKLTVETTGGGNGNGLLVTQLGYTMLDVNTSSVVFKPYPSASGQITTNNWNSAGGSHTTFFTKNSEFTPTGYAYAIPIAKFPDANIPVVMGNTATASLRSYLNVSGNFTAISNLAAGQQITSTLTAAANNDVLVGLDINNTFTNGAYTGLSNYSIRTYNKYKFETLSDLAHGLYWSPANDGTTLKIYGSSYSGGMGYLQLNVLSGGDGMVANGSSHSLSINAAQTSIGLNLTNITFNTHGTGEAMRIVNSTKNVLVGTTTDAGQKLQISGNQATTIAGTGDGFNLTRTGAYDNTTLTTLATITDTTSNANRAKTGLYVNVTNASTNIAIQTVGAVGVGTTPPSNSFATGYFSYLWNGATVNSAANYNLNVRSQISSYAAGNGGGLSFWGDDRGQAGANTAFAGIRGVKENSTYLNGLGALIFLTQASSAGLSTESTFAEVGRFTSGGNFGIGTTTPSYKLDVNGTARATTVITDTITTSGSTTLASYAGTTYTYGPIVANPASFTFTFQSQPILYGNISSGYIPKANTIGMGNSQIWNSFSNNILIGTTTDTGQKLQVSGSALISSLAGTGTRMVVADSAGALSTQSIPGGALANGSWEEDSTQTAAAPNQGFGVKFSTLNFRTGVNVVTDSGGNYTFIQMTNTARYNIQFSLQFQNTDNVDQDVYVWLRKNGETPGDDIPNSNTIVSIPAKHAGIPGHTVAAWNLFVDAAGGDFYQLVWATDDATNVTMEYYPSTGFCPATPSAILTVNQVS